MFGSTEMRDKLEISNVMHNNFAAYVNIVAIKLPNSPQELEEDDEPNLDEPWQKPTSSLDLDSIVHKIRRQNKHEEVKHIQSTPELHRVADVGFKERRVELSGVTAVHAIDELIDDPDVLISDAFYESSVLYLPA